MIVPSREPYVARVERVLRRADVVKVSDEDLAYLFPDSSPLDAARAVLALGPKAVLLTAGGGAVHVIARDGETEVPVPRVEVVDTIGAGDSFGGGFLAWWQASGRPVEQLGSLDALVPAVRGRRPGRRHRVSPAAAPTRRGATSSPPTGPDLGADAAVRQSSGRAGQVGETERCEDQVGAAVHVVDHEAAELLGHAARRAAATGRAHHDPVVVETGGALEARTPERCADPGTAPIGDHGEEQLTGAVDPGEADDPAVLDRRDPEAAAAAERLDQRRERLRVRLRARPEVPRFAAERRRGSRSISPPNDGWSAEMIDVPRVAGVGVASRIMHTIVRARGDTRGSAL